MTAVRTNLSMTSTPHGARTKRYRIGDLVRHSGLSRQTLHNYTRWGLITEAEWTAGGHRLYDEQTLARLSVIVELKRHNTIDEIRAKLPDLLVRRSAS